MCVDDTKPTFSHLRLAQLPRRTFTHFSCKRHYNYVARDHAAETRFLQTPLELRGHRSRSTDTIPANAIIKTSQRSRSRDTFPANAIITTWPQITQQRHDSCKRHYNCVARTRFPRTSGNTSESIPQWQGINESTTTRRRRGDDEPTTTRSTRGHRSRRHETNFFASPLGTATPKDVYTLFLQTPL